MPADAFFKKMSAECSRVHICIDSFLFGSPYVDVASMSALPKYTGGQVNSTIPYTGFLYYG